VFYNINDILELCIGVMLSFHPSSFLQAIIIYYTWLIQMLFILNNSASTIITLYCV